MEGGLQNPSSRTLRCKHQQDREPNGFPCIWCFNDEVTRREEAEAFVQALKEALATMENNHRELQSDYNVVRTQHIADVDSMSRLTGTLRTRAPLRLTWDRLPRLIRLAMGKAQHQSTRSAALVNFLLDDRPQHGHGGQGPSLLSEVAIKNKRIAGRIVALHESRSKLFVTFATKCEAFIEWNMTCARSKGTKNMLLRVTSKLWHSKLKIAFEYWSDWVRTTRRRIRWLQGSAINWASQPCKSRSTRNIRSCRLDIGILSHFIALTLVSIEQGRLSPIGQDIEERHRQFTNSSQNEENMHWQTRFGDGQIDASSSSCLSVQFLGV